MIELEVRGKLSTLKTMENIFGKNNVEKWSLDLLDEFFMNKSFISREFYEEYPYCAVEIVRTAEDNMQEEIFAEKLTKMSEEERKKPICIKVRSGALIRVID